MYGNPFYGESWSPPARQYGRRSRFDFSEDPPVHRAPVLSLADQVAKDRKAADEVALSRQQSIDASARAAALPQYQGLSADDLTRRLVSAAEEGRTDIPSYHNLLPQLEQTQFTSEQYQVLSRAMGLGIARTRGHLSKIPAYTYGNLRGYFEGRVRGGPIKPVTLEELKPAQPKKKGKQNVWLERRLTRENEKPSQP